MENNISNLQRINIHKNSLILIDQELAELDKELRKILGLEGK
jgi:hypothetical protein